MNKEQLLSYIDSAIRMKHNYFAVVFKNENKYSINIIDTNLFFGFRNDIDEIYNEDCLNKFADWISIVDYVSSNNIDVINRLTKKYLS